MQAAATGGSAAGEYSGSGIDQGAPFGSVSRSRWLRVVVSLLRLHGVRLLISGGFVVVADSCLVRSLCCLLH